MARTEHAAPKTIERYLKNPTRSCFIGQPRGAKLPDWGPPGFAPVTVSGDNLFIPPGGTWYDQHNGYTLLREKYGPTHFVRCYDDAELTEIERKHIRENGAKLNVQRGLQEPPTLNIETGEETPGKMYGGFFDPLVILQDVTADFRAAQSDHLVVQNNAEEMRTLRAQAAEAEAAKKALQDAMAEQKAMAEELAALRAQRVKDSATKTVDAVIGVAARR